MVAVVVRAAVLPRGENSEFSALSAAYAATDKKAEGRFAGDPWLPGVILERFEVRGPKIRNCVEKNAKNSRCQAIGG